MLEDVSRFFERLEQKPPPLAGSGCKWIVDSEASDEREANQAVIDALPLAIGEKQLPGGLPEILRRVIERGTRCSTNDNSPGYMAYIPSGGLFHAAVADLVAAAVNRYVTIDQAAPVFAAIEHECIKWMCTEVIGWSAGGPSGGVLTSGGALANMFGLHAARTSKIRIADLPKATVYVSEQAHYCVEMGARFIGVQPSHVRKVPSNPSDHSVNLDILKSVLEVDVEKGLIPIAVCAMVGTTNSGAVDDLEGIAKLCNEKDVWMHVDGAYGGFFALTGEGRALLKGMEKANSIVLDPHKSLFLPYGLGALLVRDKFSLQKGNRSDGACMQPPPADGSTDSEDIMNLSPELTRNFRGLRMWLPLQMLGAEAFRAQLGEKLALARHAASAIGDGSVPNLRITAQPQLSIFTFKLDDGVKKGADLDALNAEFLNNVHRRGNALLSPFRSVNGVPGELCIRMAILSHRTDLATVDTAIADIRAAALDVQGFASACRRSSFLASAADDFVKDYRELAKMGIWDSLLEGSQGSLRVLDACAGTGRWVQAFSEIVLKDREALKNREVLVDFIDLCSDSIAVLEKRLRGLPNITVGKCFTGNLCESGKLGVPSLGYDLIVNMHGLYGFSKGSLPSALQAMHDALRPGGTMILAIGTQKSSPYQHVPTQCFGIPLINETSIVQALEGLGIQSTTTHITYMEEYLASDEAALHRFLMDECGGNCFPTDVAEGMATPEAALRDYSEAHLDRNTGSFRFHQEVAVITVRRDAHLLPEMQSFGPFYSEAYGLRRGASTMQSNMVEWLKKHAEEHILQRSEGPAGRPLRICSIGCGDGELEIALMEGIAHSVEGYGYSGIELVGLEPSPSFRQRFVENFSRAQGRGALPSTEKCRIQLEGEAFEPNGVSDYAQDGEADIVMLGHVMYYFQSKEEGLRSALRKARPGGVTVVIHQGKQGVPELQAVLLPRLRGSVRDMFSADDVEVLLTGALRSDVGRFDRHDVDAFLDVSAIVKGTDEGAKIMSFCLEADHRTANDEVLQMSRDAFAGAAVQKAEAGRSGGPFLRELVSCFVISSAQQACVC